MKSFTKPVFANVYTRLTRQVFYRIILSCLLALVLFSAAAVTPPTTQALAYADPGTIAYVRDVDATGDEIRLIEPDGSNDRLLWRTNQPLNGLQQIYDLAWHPAATDLAFASRHEEACSMYSSDVYTIRADGSGYRRVTAPPACGNPDGLPTGAVNVSIANWTSDNGPFIVYFEGASGPQSITLGYGESTVVTFTNVVDFGSFKQWGVVVFGQYRFFAVTGNADIVPGQTVNTTSTINISYGYQNWGWTSPSWNSDGSQIAYIFNGLTPYWIPASSTAPGIIGGTLFDVAIGANPYSERFLTWAPPGPLADKVLFVASDQSYTSSYVWLGTPGSSSAGDILFDIDPDDFGHYLLGLAWLPDSSGFLYSRTEGFGESANIYEYDFASGTSTQITNFTSGYPRRLSVSPDGSHVVFEYQASGSWYDYSYNLDLYMMDRYGNASLFVEDARAPAWSPAALPGPVVLDQRVFVPAVIKH